MPRLADISYNVRDAGLQQRALWQGTHLTDEMSVDLVLICLASLLAEMIRYALSAQSCRTDLTLLQATVISRSKRCTLSEKT
jgi:hypothetical protein